MNELIPTRIKEVRKNLHMSQTEFAELLGTTQVSVSALECGSRALSTDMALKIAKNCNVSVDWLCGLSDQKSAVSTPKFRCAQTAYGAYRTAYRADPNNQAASAVTYHLRRSNCRIF